MSEEIIKIHFEEINSTLKEIKGLTEKHNARLSKIERWMYTMAGGIIVIAFLFPVFQALMSEKITSVQDDLDKHIASVK